MYGWVLRLFDHMFWADERLLDLLHGSTDARVPEVLRVTSHLIAAERVWLARLRGDGSGALPIWPDWTLGEVTAAAESTREEYQALLGDLEEEQELLRQVSYTNSSGAAFSNSVLDILTHVALHGSYHRGQVANAVRRAGAEPINTDFITYVRGRPDPEITGTAPSLSSDPG